MNETKIGFILTIIFFIVIGTVLVLIGKDAEETKEMRIQKLKCDYYMAGYLQACKDIDNNQSKCKIYISKDGEKKYILNKNDFNIDVIEKSIKENE